MIRIEELSKRYGTTQALNGVSMRFDPGRVYGIVGENGAGKTTLFRCMAGLEDCKGRVESDPAPLRHHLGLLLTEPFFFPRMTGAEYIRLLCNARGRTLKDTGEENLFELPLDRYAAVYSTGMKKKLALTAILLQGNSFFILDEPFNGVDIQSNLLITGIIRELKNRGKTILLSSHIFSTLSDTCDEIHLLKAGQLVKSVQKADFGKLETEMKETTIGDKIRRMVIL